MDCSKADFINITMPSIDGFNDCSLDLWHDTNNDNLEKQQLEEEEEEELSTLELLPRPHKSKIRYLTKYKSFCEWRTKKFNTNVATEDMMLNYFKELAEKSQPSTLYSVYSLLKTMLLQAEKTDISTYAELKKFLSTKSKGFKSKKAEHLTAQNVSDFVKFAPNKKYLASKVILIFGVTGACKNSELKRIRISDVTEHGKLFQVNIPLTETLTSRSFIINEEFYPIVKQYITERPPPEDFSIPVHQDFFLHYKDGVCSTQQMGKNTIATIPKQVAEYLKLPNASIYTGHCFRQTAAKIRSSKFLNNSDILVDKRFLDSVQLSNEDSSQSQSNFNKQDTASSESEDEERVTRSSKHRKTIKKRNNSHFTQDLDDSCTIPEMEAQIDSDDDYVPAAKKPKTKSTDKYSEYVNWQKSSGMKESNETTLLAYFTILSNKLEPNELLATYSTIKTMLWKKEKINIKHYEELNLFLKSNCQSSTKQDDEEEEETTIRNFAEVTLCSENFWVPKIEMIDSVEEACSDVDDDASLIESESSEKNLESLPSKSKMLYLNRYKRFTEWRETEKIKTTNEATLLDYFEMLASKNQPSTLMAVYAMLKLTLKEKEKIDISNFNQLNSYLKEKSEKHEPKKAEHLTAKNVSDFIKNAPDKKYLAAKVILIFGVIGDCKTLELRHIKFTDVKEHDQLFCVTIAATKTEMSRSFIINKEFYPIVKKYINKRPKIEDFPNPIGNFFLHYRDGKCTTQQIGKNTFGAIPKKVAEYLKLPNANFYTGHCFRQTFANIQANQNLSLQDVSEDENLSDPLQVPTNKETPQFETFIIKNEAVLNSENEVSIAKSSDASDNDSEDESSSSRTKIDFNSKYEEFLTWRKSVDIKETKENTLLAYFAILSHKLDYNKLLDSYCAIKKTLWDKEEVDIRTFEILNLFLKHCKNNITSEEKKVSRARGTDDLQSEPKVDTDEKLETQNDEMNESEDDDLQMLSGSRRSGYEKFVEWREAVDKKETTEKVLMSYFKLLSIKFTPSTLYKIYSNLKTELMEKETIDIGKFTELKSFLRLKTNSYEPVKAEAFTVKNVKDFIMNAPDKTYLAAKVILIFGISGACKTTELRLITIKDVEEHGQIFCVNIPKSKTKAGRTFIVNEKFYSIVKRYIGTRPEDNIFQDFFLNYQKGRCSRNPIGRNKIANTPKQIAEFLNLPFASNYTSYSFRETSANIRAEFKLNIINSEKKKVRKKGSVKKYSEDSPQNSQPEGSPSEDPLHFESCFIKEELSNPGSFDSED